MQFWQQGYRNDTLREWDISPEEAMGSRVGNRFNATVKDLLPFTTVEVTVAVMNNYYVSPPSDVYRFQTDPGCELTAFTVLVNMLICTVKPPFKDKKTKQYTIRIEP